MILFMKWKNYNSLWSSILDTFLYLIENSKFHRLCKPCDWLTTARLKAKVYEFTYGQNLQENVSFRGIKQKNNRWTKTKPKLVWYDVEWNYNGWVKSVKVVENMLSSSLEVSR